MVLDANVIWGNNLRDLLIQLHDDGVIRAYLSREILDEWERTILARHKVDPTRLARTRGLIEHAMTDAIVQDIRGVAPDLSLPDIGDTHVARAAIAVEANAIVTFNLKDFPEASLSPFGVCAIHPDTYLCAVLDQDPAGVLESVHKICARRSAPTQTLEDLATKLAAAGVPTFAARLKSLKHLA